MGCREGRPGRILLATAPPSAFKAAGVEWDEVIVRPCPGAVPPPRAGEEMAAKVKHRSTVG